MRQLAVLLVWICSLSGLTSAQKKPEIGFVTPSVETDIGGNAEIDCNVRNNPKDNPYPISWMRLGQHPLTLSRGPDLQFDDHRMNISLHHDKNASSYTLSIANVRKSDATGYRCQVVIDADNILEKDAFIHVRLEPVIESIADPTVKVKEGSPAVMMCNATGYPDPVVDWSRKDGSLMPNGKPSFTDKRLRIEKVKREDRGLYECFAHNSVGSGQRKSVALEVEFSPEVRSPRPRVAQAVGYEAELECEIVAFPPPSILWYRDGQEIRDEDGKYQILHFAEEDEKQTSTLKIFEVCEKKYGVYKCEARNRRGKDSKQIELYSANMPICPPLCGDTDLNSGAIVATPTLATSLMVTTALAKFFS